MPALKLSIPKFTTPAERPVLASYWVDQISPMTTDAEVSTLSLNWSEAVRNFLGPMKPPHATRAERVFNRIHLNCMLTAKTMRMARKNELSEELYKLHFDAMEEVCALKIAVLDVRGATKTFYEQVEKNHRTGYYDPFDALQKAERTRNTSQFPTMV